MSSPWSGRTRALTVALAWAAALGAATVVGMTAVNAIGSGIVGAGQEPLSQSEVDARLSATPAATGAPAPSTTPPPTSSSSPAPTTTTAVVEPTVVNSRGGSIIARCSGGLVEIMSTTPAQGFQTRTESGEDHPSIRFTSGRSRVEVRLRCVGGIPRPEIKDG